MCVLAMFRSSSAALAPLAAPTCGWLPVLLPEPRPRAPGRSRRCTRWRGGTLSTAGKHVSKPSPRRCSASKSLPPGTSRCSHSCRMSCRLRAQTALSLWRRACHTLPLTACSRSARHKLRQQRLLRHARAPVPAGPRAEGVAQICHPAGAAAACLRALCRRCAEGSAPWHTWPRRGGRGAWRRPQQPHRRCIPAQPGVGLAYAGSQHVHGCLCVRHQPLFTDSHA